MFGDDRSHGQFPATESGCFVETAAQRRKAPFGMFEYFCQF